MRSEPRSALGIPDLLRTLLVLLVWALWLAWRLLVTLVGWGPPDRLRGRVRRAQLLLLLGGLAAFGAKVVPVYWARFAWMDQARQACRRPRGRSEAEIQSQLLREAARLGLGEAAEGSEAVQVERWREGEVERMRISLRLSHRVDLFGFWAFQLPVRGAGEAVVEMPEAAPSPLDETFGR